MEEKTHCEHLESQKLYKIGVFSQLNRLTVKTLRYYDDANLLKPAYVDETSGYRYYTSSQLPQLHKILALKEIGFSISEIQQVLVGASEEKLLLKKKSELLREVAELNRKLAHIEGCLAGGGIKHGYRVIVKSLPEIIVASMRVHLSSYEDLFHKMPDMGAEMETSNCVCVEPTYCFSEYYDGEYKEYDIDAKICEAVTEMKPDTPTLKFERLPEVKCAACLLHKGPYHRLPLAYAAIVQFMEESGYEIIGPQRESYIDGVWNKDSDEDWLTEIQFPVRKINL